MSDFFGKLKPYSGAYHPSVYAKYSRGGDASRNGTGTLGAAWAYKRPQFDSGGVANDSDDPADDQIAQIVQATTPQQQRQPGLQERVFKFEANKDQLYAGSPFNTAANTAALAQLDADSQDKIDKAAAKRVIHPNQAARKKSQLAKLLHGKPKSGAATP